MKTATPNLHGRVTVLTIQERDTLEIDRQYYLGLGYPTWKAAQYAWDHFHVARGTK